MNHKFKIIIHTDISSHEPWIRFAFMRDFISLKCDPLEEEPPFYGHYLSRNDAIKLIELLTEYV